MDGGACSRHQFRPSSAAFTHFGAGGGGVAGRGGAARSARGQPRQARRGGHALHVALRRGQRPPVRRPRRAHRRGHQDRPDDPRGPPRGPRARAARQPARGLLGGAHRLDLLRRLLGVKTSDGGKGAQVAKVEKNEMLLVNIGSTSTGGRVLACKEDDHRARIELSTFVCTQQGEKVTLSRRVDKHWRLIGWGQIRKESKTREGRRRPQGRGRHRCLLEIGEHDYTTSVVRSPAGVAHGGAKRMRALKVLPSLDG